MKSTNYDKDIKELFVILICLVFILGYFTFIKITYKDTSSPGDGGSDVVSSSTFNESFVKNVNTVSGSDNYLVSPYSVEVALNMLKKGANGATLEEINAVVEDRTINTFDIKDRIGVANALFIKEAFKDSIVSGFSDSLKSSYGAEIIYDKFESPDVINKWCKEKTWSMIDKLMDSIDANFVYGVANAVAIDVEWANAFECSKTISKEFTKSDGSSINVEMMSNSYTSDVSYFEDDNSKGVIIPYKKYDKDGKESDSGTNLEFVGILPNENVSDYINSLSDGSLSNVGGNATLASEKKINVSLPRFKYDFNLSTFKDVLVNMGISSAFDEDVADFTNAMEKETMTSLGIDNLYVDTAIHKTHIDLNEKGTKAAAVTFFGVNEKSALEEKTDVIDIEFNKPFVYMIRDSATKEILFFGSVYVPNEWAGSTCTGE